MFEISLIPYFSSPGSDAKELTARLIGCTLSRAAQVVACAGIAVKLGGLCWGCAAHLRILTGPFCEHFEPRLIF